jgi:hypothetical protein
MKKFKFIILLGIELKSNYLNYCEKSQKKVLLISWAHPVSNYRIQSLPSYLSLIQS